MLTAQRARLSALLTPWAARYDRIRRTLERRVALNRWFPHGLLALALLFFGLLLLYRAGDSLLGSPIWSFRLDELNQHIAEANLEGVPDFVIGGLLTVQAIGLALRSRFAWGITILTLGISIAFRVHPAIADDHSLVLTARVLLWLALVFNRRHFYASSGFTQGAFSVYALLAFFAVASALTLRRGGHFDPPIEDPLTALYFVVIAVSSVGFGDITPISPSSRGFVLSVILTGLAVVGTAFSVSLIPIVGNRFRKMMGREEGRMKRVRHYVVIGTSSLARNTASELEQRGQSVTLILDQASDHPFYETRDVVIGDATDLEVLQTAGVPMARGVLALSVDDSTNGFIVLGVNELDSTIPTVAALNDSANRARLNRTQPSMLLSLHSLGGQLLAMALTGEHIDEEVLDDVLKIHPSTPPASDPEPT